MYIALPVLALLLIFVTALAVRTGSVGLSWREFTGGLLKTAGYEKFSVIIRNVRLPRVLGAVLAGAGLSVSGALLQTVTDNGLAGPNIIGVNAGAGFAVMIFLWLVPFGAGLIPFAAFAGAFLATMLIIALSQRVNSSKSTVILAGIAVTAILNAGISFISLLDTDVLSAYNYFSVGGLSAVTGKELVIPAVIIGISLLVTVFAGRRIDMLCLGDSVAASLGVNVRAMRMVCLIIASASASAVVSFAGLLGFVGLVVPHIARRLTGSRMTRLIPVSALLGAILVVLADLVGRVVFAPTEIPVGIVMAFVGTPFFFRLLLRRKNHAED